MLLKVSDLHEIFYETAGNPDGVPVLFIHGGPGGGSRFRPGFDLNRHFLIRYDQRGCGQSLPPGEIKENTTADLIADIKKLLARLKLERVVIYARSWGATLALLYAESFPDDVSALFLAATFAARVEDSHFLYHGVRNIYPDLNDEFIRHIPGNCRDNPAAYLFSEMEKGDINRKKEIAALIGNYEHALMTISQSLGNRMDPAAMADDEWFSARIFLHYEMNRFFIDDCQLAKQASKIEHVPTYMVHGRYDMDAPFSGAYRIHKALPNSDMIVIPYESHSGNLQNELLLKNFYRYCNNL